MSFIKSLLDDLPVIYKKDRRKPEVSLFQCGSSVNLLLFHDNTV